MSNQTSTKVTKSDLVNRLMSINDIHPYDQVDYTKRMMRLTMGQLKAKIYQCRHYNRLSNLALLLSECGHPAASRYYSIANGLLLCEETFVAARKYADKYYPR